MTRARRISHGPVAVVLALLVGCPALAPSPARAAPFERIILGDPADARTNVAGGLVLIGGGTDVDDAFRYLIERSGGGDVVVLRASGTDAYNPYIRDLGGADSVATLIIKRRRAAFDPGVIETIRGAEALFIAGGDQSNYVRRFKGTPIEEAIHHLAARGVPIGGTSAGLAIMGEFSFTALNDTVTSVQALADPYHRRVVLERDFLALPGLAGTITDSHVAERDRMGRLVAFLARIVQDGWATTARGIAIDRETALLVDPGGRVRVAGPPAAAAWFLRTPGPPEVCRPGQPLTYRNLPVHRLAGGATFDLPTWTGTGGSAYTITAEGGTLTSSRPDGGVY